MEIKQEFQHIIRVANTDLIGGKSCLQALRKIKGVGFMMANALCVHTSIDENKKAGDLTADEIKKIEDILKDPKVLPAWMLNRRKDYESGEDKHVINAELKLSREFDIKRLQLIKSYRGLRHAWGLPVRGQKTRSNFRKGSAIGVKKSKQKTSKG